jgi:hypothetical protein
MILTKRQANTIIAGILAILVMQTGLGLMLLRGQQGERARTTPSSIVIAQSPTSTENQSPTAPGLTDKEMLVRLSRRDVDEQAKIVEQARRNLEVQEAKLERDADEAMKFDPCLP